MPMMIADRSVLLMIDLQLKLMPAMPEREAVVAGARRLRDAAGLIGVPVLATEQNPGKLGGTVPELALHGPALSKMWFDAGRDPHVAAVLPDRETVIIAGVEAHVCVLQTALGLVARGRRVAVVEDAVGSRAPASKAAALRRLDRHGVEIVTVEMVVFEWLGSAEHPRFREAVTLIK